MASGNPDRPSQHTISGSLTPRFATSASTEAQNSTPSAEPDPEDVLDAVHVDADPDVGGLVTLVPAVADLDDQGDRGR
jgi:hypothetical protein